MAKFDRRHEMSLQDFVNTLKQDLVLKLIDYTDETGRHHHYYAGNDMRFTVSEAAEPLLLDGNFDALIYLECKRKELPNKKENWFRCILKADLLITIKRTK